MTEKELRESVAAFLVPYLGCKEGGTLHKQLIDLFNNSGLCTRYKMTYTDAWCATAVSDAFIATGLTSIFPCVEVSCALMLNLAKSAGIWVEDDAYVPSVGDVILYDWDDTTGSKSDNTGTPDHVGIITAVSGTALTVIEGNKSDTVGYRAMTVNGTYIRGYITPNYASVATGSDTGSTVTPGWKQDTVGWWYQNADGTYPSNCWMKIAESANPSVYHWYAFDSNGYMRTGWIKYDRNTGLFDTESGKWYFLETTKNDVEGACYHEIVYADGTYDGALDVWDVE